MLLLIGSDGVSISLFVVHQFIQIHQHVEEDAALIFLSEELVECELDADLRLQQVDHLTYNILKVYD